MHRPPAISAGVDAAVPMTPRSGHPGLEVPDLYLGLSKPPAHQASAYTHRQSSRGGYAESDEATASALQLLRSGDVGVYQQHRASAEDAAAAAAAMLDRHAADCCLDTHSPDTPGAVSGRVWPYSTSPFEQTTPPARDVALPLRSDSPDDMFGGAAGADVAADPTNSSLDSAMGSPLAGGSPLGEQLWAAPVTSRPLAQHIRPLHRGARTRTLSGPLAAQWEEAAGGAGIHPNQDDGCPPRSPVESWGGNLTPAALQGVRHTFAARRARSMVQLDADYLLTGRSASLHSTSYKSLSASSRTSLKTTGGGGGGAYCARRAPPLAQRRTAVQCASRGAADGLRRRPRRVADAVDPGESGRCPGGLRARLVPTRSPAGTPPPQRGVSAPW